ncbi:HIRAN domain protein [compost metagenome]
MTLSVVGLNHDGRADALRNFAQSGGRARIEREPENAADRNAIAIRIAVGGIEQHEPEWVLVGYVAADRAAVVAPLIDLEYFQNLRFVLRVDLQGATMLPKVALELTYAVEDGDPDAEIRAARSGQLVAELGYLRWDNIEGIKTGDAVSLWAHPDGDRVHTYRRGSIGGLGFLGSATNRRLIKQVDQRLPYRAFIHWAGSRAWLTVSLDR